LLESAKTQVKIEVYEGFDMVAMGTIQTHNIIANFISEVTVELKNKGEKVGDLIMRLGVKTFLNRNIKPRPKAKTKLEM
jgi:dissimilatory sulfite reductase (desulfoviridin) alpha/beta subunit